MKIRDFKKNSIILIISLIVTGAVITTIGFGSAGFNLNKVKEMSSKPRWYQTIHNNDDHLWYGIEPGSHLHIISIGDAD